MDGTLKVFEDGSDRREVVLAVAGRDKHVVDKLALISPSPKGDEWAVRGRGGGGIIPWSELAEALVPWADPEDLCML